MKTINIQELQQDTVRYLREAGDEDIIIVSNGQPVGILQGVASTDDIADHAFESHPHFRARVARARRDIQAGKGQVLDIIRDELLAADEPRTPDNA